MEQVAEKACTKCGKVQPVEEFHRRNNRAGGRVPKCRTCYREQYAARPSVEPAMEGERTCWDCGETKHITEFPKHKKERDGRHQLCKACHRAREKKAREDRPEVFLERRRTVGKARELRANYGITLEEYKSMLEAQGGGCAICGVVPSEATRHLAVDHDHRCCAEKKRSCGKCIRGLLCAGCNRAIGWLNDDPELVAKALAYLTR